ncbi:alanine racemase [Pseudazoarcus pumilus]|uniref:Alanine racemase n=1 Tax=Pseudazoarcus pumilus TaxID=2067960 RepID=A0A2I6S2V6_9RHOO|nr:alanine racemase [Pseudazoarcus pumilus]AUN93547.1 alanine racemase [Pseudazoarcus pumilus]
MRPARALIDLDALRHNYRLARARHGARMLAVIKANAYGHGAVQCARALEDEADAFAVAFIDEAMVLREAGILRPILLLEGPFSTEEVQRAAAFDLWPVVHHAGQLAMFDAADLPQPIDVWLKLNTGMNRAGFEPEDVRAAWLRLRDSGNVGEITLMTHLARADEPQVITTDEQVATFDAAIAGLEGPRSLSNSPATLGWPSTHADWGRAGILLYGADPMPDEASGLRAVMTLESEVISVREVPAGTPVGYGARFVTSRPTRLGLVAMGYADGYPRSTRDGTPVAVDGMPARLAGRVSMDLLTVDLTDVPGAGPGSRVELWGPQVPVNRVAQAAGTIAYEVLCNVKRARFEYRG